MNREIIENQIILCLELQKKCGIENIETFLALSKRVVELDKMLSSTEEHQIRKHRAKQKYFNNNRTTGNL